MKPTVDPVYYSDYFRLETHDSKELMEGLIDFLNRLHEAEIYECDVDYIVAYGYVEVNYSVTVEEARKLGYDDEAIAILTEPDNDEDSVAAEKESPS
jgi:hypothetical protein